MAPPAPIDGPGTKIPDQNGDRFFDRAVDQDGRRVIYYRQENGSFSWTDPLIHDEHVTYRDKSYFALQKSPDTWKKGKSQKDGTVCLNKSRQNTCEKGAPVVPKQDVHPFFPMLFVISSSTCLSCGPLLEELTTFLNNGWCQTSLLPLEIDKIPFKIDFRGGEGPPVPNMQVPLVSLLRTDGSWSHFKQYAENYGSNTPRSYAYYLMGEMSRLTEHGLPICVAPKEE